MSGTKQVEVVAAQEEEEERTPKLEAQSKRLYLERMTVDRHLDDFRELWVYPEAMKWSTKPPMTTDEDALPRMESTLPNEENPDIDKFAIMLKDPMEPHHHDAAAGTPTAPSPPPPKMIGLVGTNRWCKDGEGVGLETGYCLNMAHWNKGYATEAFACFLEYYWTLEERKNVNTLVAKVHPDHVASQRVLQKCGARRGETLSAVYQRYIDKGEKSDVWCWYFDRPGVGSAEVRKGDLNGEIDLK